jgi:hypothetical protein
MFVYEGEFLSNINDNRVLDVKGGKDAEHTEVLVWKRHGKANQRWKIVYLDKAGPVETKGLNEEFGFHINRPFYIRSRLPMQRVLECHGANNIWLKRYRKNVPAQQFYFDEVSKTVKSQQWKDRSLTIQSRGGSSNLHMTTTDSRWW